MRSERSLSKYKNARQLVRYIIKIKFLPHHTYQNFFGETVVGYDQKPAIIKLDKPECLS